MKPWSVVIIYMLIAIFGQATHASDDVMWIKQLERVYGGPGRDGISSMVPTADGGYLLLGGGFSASELSVHKLDIYKLDKNGYLEWQRELLRAPSGLAHGFTINGRNALKHTADGGCVVVAAIDLGDNTPPTETDRRAFWMVKLDAHGNEVWSSIINPPGHATVGSIAVVPGGGYVFSGGVYSPGKSNLDAFLVKVDGNGKMLWERIYAAIGGPDGHEGAYDVEPSHDNDNGFVLAGFTSHDLGYWSPFLMETDASGNKQSVSVEDVPGMIYASARVPDGGYIVVGESAGNAMLAKFDKNLVREWRRTFEPSYFQGVAVAADGFFATGRHGTGSRTHFYVIHADWNGNLLHESTFNQGAGASIWALPEGGFVAAGNVDENLPLIGLGGTDLYLLKVKELKKPGYIVGSVYSDENLTCSIDANAESIGHRLVQAVDQESNVYFVPVSSAGNYSVAVPPGQYTLNLVHDERTTETCHPDRTYTTEVSRQETSGGNDFSIAAMCCADVSLRGVQSSSGGYTCNAPASQTTPCPGYNWTYCATVLNCGASPWSDDGSSSVCFPPDQPIDTYTTSCTGWVRDGSCFRRNEKFLSSFNSCDICVTFQVPLQSPPTVTTSTALQALCTNGGRSRDVASLVQRSDCSCDPNDMHVEPRGCGTGGAITGQEMTYTLHFQNVGAGPAHGVVLRNPLDEALDPSTLRIVSSSHHITSMQVEPDNELVIRFDGIELPAEVRDPVGSNGSVTYVIHPKRPFVDGTVISNGAAIFFDSNPPVMTNKVSNTLYNGGPVPVADFRAVRRGAGFDFTYTGGSTDISYQWNFGANAMPPRSTVPHPTGVTFNGSGPHLVNLTVDKNGCAAATSQDVTACEPWSASAFEPPMGKPRQLGAMLPVKFALSYQGDTVRSSAQLKAILTSQYGWTPDQGCWPRARITTENGQEVSLGDTERCFRFDDEGKLLLNLKLEGKRFQAGQSYRIEVQNDSCALGPENNSFLIK